MAFAAGAAVTIPTLGALGTIAYYAKHPADPSKQQHQRRRSSFMSVDSHRKFVGEDDPSEFSSFASAPDVMDSRMTMRRRSSLPTSGMLSADMKPDHKLLEDPHLQVWRDRYKWGRNYGINFAHNDR